MAYTRLSDKEITGGDFAAFVEGQTTLFSRQLSIRNAEEEVSFNEAVLAGNLTLAEQLDWRKEQFKKVKNDPEERRRVRAEVANLKDRIEQRTFADAYLEKLTSFESGASSIDSVVNWLEDQKASATDTRIKDSINTSLREQKNAQFTIHKQIIENETAFAIKDKSAAVLSTHLDKVRVEKNKAAFSGDNLLISVYDLQIQSLEKAVTENSVEKSITGFAVNTMTNGSNSTDLLDSYNSEVSEALTSGNIQIGGSLYGSAKEFWRFRRGQYISDQGANGFFSRFTGEKNQELGLINGQQDVSIDDIKSISQEYDQLATRVELKDFQFQINTNRQLAVQTGTDYAANDILSQFNRDFDVNKAVTGLNSLKLGGGDVSLTFDKIIQTAAANKTTQVDSILQSVQTALTNNPGLSAEQALDLAIKSGAGSILSPEQLAGKGEEEIVGEQITGAQEEAFIEDPRTTAPQIDAPPVVPEGEVAPPEPTEKRFEFTQERERGSQGADVFELQKFLNQAGFQVSASGAGAPGAETEFFGPATQAALLKFQEAEFPKLGLAVPTTTGKGRLGPQTLSAISQFKFQ